MKPASLLQQLILMGVVGLIIGSGLTLVVRPIWEASASEKASDWLGFAGNILACVVAVSAAWLGWQGVKKQLRISVISREEERIEKELPGLRQIERKFSALAERLTEKSAPQSVINALEWEGLGKTSTKYLAEADAMFPSAYDHQKKAVADLIYALLLDAGHAQVAAEKMYEISKEVNRLIEENADLADVEKRFKHSRKQNEELSAVLRTSLLNLGSMHHECTTHIAELIERHRKCRSEIDEFFKSK